MTTTYTYGKLKRMMKRPKKLSCRPRRNTPKDQRPRVGHIHMGSTLATILSPQSDDLEQKLYDALDTMNRDQLREWAKAAAIEGRGHMSKSQLREALEQAVRGGFRP